MAKTTVIVTVDSLILAAGVAASNMYTKAKDAAKLASAELDSAKPLGVRIADVMTAHADAFKTAGHNVKAIFSDALTLYACPADAVTVPTSDKKDSQISTAAKAVDLSKHVMRAAAKEVRETHGLGRKVTPKATAPAKSDAPKVSDDAAFKSMLSDLADALKTPDYAARIIAFMGVAGYVVAPKTKTSDYTTTKDTAVKAPKIKSMADLPSLKVTGAAAH